MVESVAPLTVVLGGAGTGKTACALGAAEAHLERESATRFERVLVLSFSRAAVVNIDNRSRGDFSSRVDIMTFHGLAYSLIRRFGWAVGLGRPNLISAPRQLLGSPPGSITYDQLLPAALRIIREVPAVREYLSVRWKLVIVDEFQDTDDSQAALVEEISVGARRILLGDRDQCIYTFRAGDGVRLSRITDACREAGPVNTVALPDISHRDRTQVIPAVARDILHRDFNSDAIKIALNSGRLSLAAPVTLDNEVVAVSEIIRDLRGQDLGVAVFTHHNDMLANLSDGLVKEGIDHEIAGLSEAFACAIDAQLSLLQFSQGVRAWDEALEALAVFITSAQRGRQVPPLAHQVRQGGNGAVGERLATLRGRLSGSCLIDSIDVIADVHLDLLLPNKTSAWSDAASAVATAHARLTRGGSRAPSDAVVAVSLERAAQELASSALTESRVAPHTVQLMNLYQTKGREADATVVVLREGDWLGDEGEPWSDTSRLLYVVFSRAREKIVIVPVGDNLHPAVAPLGDLVA